MSPKTVLNFWFDEISSELWFKQDDELDRVIKERFGRVHEEAAASQLGDWEQTPEGALALVIVLDQFSRNMFRGSPRAYENDAKALTVAKRSIAAGLDKKLAKKMRAFLYMPFMHSEDIEVQNESVRLFEELDGENQWATQHRDDVARFGRFPYRNEILGRKSTPEEIEYLKNRAI